MTHPVETAVIPLKLDAIARAERDAKKTVARVRADLEAAGFDLEVAAPLTRGAPQRRAIEHHKRDLYSALTRPLVSSRRINDPLPVEMDQAKIDRFIGQCVTNAASQYDAFVIKLIKKVGACERAVLSGNHVWGHSVLTITRADGSIERWKTQQIVNQSKLGTLFNQWPTRKLRAVEG